MRKIVFVLIILVGGCAVIEQADDGFVHHHAFGVECRISFPSGDVLCIPAAFQLFP